MVYSGIWKWISWHRLANPIGRILVRLTTILVVLGAVAGFVVAGLLTRPPGLEAYCVKCREKREIQDPKVITMKNGRRATQGVCPECGTQVYRMGAAPSQLSSA
jgi:hypothetical protein